jgi:hypothetical protein
MPSTHLHPNPSVNRWTQYSVAFAMTMIVVAAPLQVILALLIDGAPLFFITAVLTLLLLPPLLMQSAATPPVSISDSGITLRPVIWKAHFVSWEAVREIKPYPLLPPADTEAMRRVMVGKKKFRAAEGIMLVIPDLPLPYRATGFFAGEGITPVVALTSRTHQNYDHLVRQIRRYCRIED